RVHPPAPGHCADPGTGPVDGQAPRDLNFRARAAISPAESPEPTPDPERRGRQSQRSGMAAGLAIPGGRGLEPATPPANKLPAEGTTKGTCPSFGPRSSNTFKGKEMFESVRMKVHT